jgi:hypothetical protein
MAQEHGQGLMAACPVHPGNRRIQPVSVLYAAQAPRELRPGPVLAAASWLAWAGTACGVLGAAAIWAGTLIGGGAAGPALIAGAVCFGYALAFYGWAAARRARLAMIRQGMPAAMAVWQAAWYCDICDGVFFRPGTFGLGSPPSRAAGVVVGDGVVLTPAAFHRLVWQAGGYGRPLGRLAG